MDRYVLDRLMRVSPFDAAPPEAVRRIASGAIVRTFRRGEALVRAGEPPDRIHLVERGLVQVGTGTPAGRAVAFGLVGPGQAAGLLYVLDAGPSPEDARALTDGVTVALPCRAIRDEIERSPPFAVAFGRFASLQARRAREDLVERTTLDVPTRLARLLVELGPPLGRSAARSPTVLPIRQHDLAGLVGSARETVSKALARFAAEGWVRTSVRRIVVIDHVALRGFGGAEEEPLEDAAGSA